MTDKRQVEIFSAGCAVCEDAVHRIKALSCSSCEVTILEMADPAVAARARSFGISSVPAVVIDGTLADCCSGGGPNESVLKAAGLGRARG